MKSEIEAAIDVLKKGGLILYPTDTIWGIGCDATNADAVKKVYQLKKRVDSKSLIILANNADMVCRYVKEVPEIAFSLIEVSDKPLTIIYPGAIGIAPNLINEDGTIGIRVPNSEFCEKLITRFKKPIVSTSANISGEPAPIFYEDITKEILDGVDFIVNLEFDNDSTHKPSSIIKLGLKNEVEIIRE